MSRYNADDRAAIQWHQDQRDVLFLHRVSLSEDSGVQVRLPEKGDAGAGCYLLRSNVADWSDEDLWKAYIQLTKAEVAFRIHKSDLSIRPI